MYKVTHCNDVCNSERMKHRELVYARMAQPEVSSARRLNTASLTATSSRQLASVYGAVGPGKRCEPLVQSKDEENHLEKKSLHQGSWLAACCPSERPRNSSELLRGQWQSWLALGLSPTSKDRRSLAYLALGNRHPDLSPGCGSCSVW